MVESTLIISVIGVIIILGTLFLLLSDKKRIPLVIPLLILGIFLGPITGIFDPVQFSEVIKVLVSFALVIVIFEAGNTVSTYTLKQQWKVFFTMSLIGPALIISLVSLFSYVFLGLRPELAVLLGALLASTDTTIMRPILESFEKRFTRIKSIVNLESTFNSVVAVTIVIIVSNLVKFKETTSLFGALEVFTYHTFLGVGMGVFFGYVIYTITCKFKEELKTHILVLGAILLLYGATKAIGGSGIISVLVLGIIFANMKPAPPRIIKSFGGDLEVLLLIFAYVILGTYLGISLTFVNIVTILFITILVILSRYLTVYLSSNAETKEEARILFLGGGKGIVCAVLALSSAPLFPNPELILNIVFSVIFVTTILASITPFYLQKLEKKQNLKLKKTSKKN